MICIKNKNILVVLLLFSVLFVGTLIFVTPGIYSTITDIGTIGQCRIVIDGSVCEEYTQCTYLSDRDISCVKGYKIIIVPISTPVISTSVTELDGGSNE